MALTLSVSLTNPDDKPLILAAEVIQAGGILVYPTETLYGIGCSATHPRALQRVQDLKKRAEAKPILVLVRSKSDLLPLVREVPKTAEALMDAFWPGPLTIVFPASEKVPKELTQGKGTIGIRIPGCALCLRLLELAGVPITSTSANLSGDAPLDTIASMRSVLTPGIDLYLDAGLLPSSKPSTVVDLTGISPRIVREGAVSTDAIRKIIPNLGVLR
jgi:L-threonylcarbamoyladenylate synthase